MATYPEGNPGVYPVEPDSLVGQFRLLYGDMSAEAYDPYVPGVGNFKELSDAEIDGYLRQGRDNVSRAIGFYLLALASRAALLAKSVKDYDLQVDTTKRASELREAADVWFDRADLAEAQAGAFDIFELYGSEEPKFHPEASPFRVGYLYTKGW